MGRRPKPTALKELAGNPGKRSLPKNEPRPDLGLPDKPKGMSLVASKEWDRLAPLLDKLGLLTNVDLRAFDAYCECYSSWKAAKAAIKKHKLVYTINGQLKKNPAVQMANDSLRLMRQYLMEFGLTPSSRAKVSAQMTRSPQQMNLPGTEGESVDPNKPQVPRFPSDAEFFDIKSVH